MKSTTSKMPGENIEINVLDHPICFANPERLVDSAWIEHIPFGMFLIDLLRPRTFVELGTYTGASYCSFCQAIKSLSVECKCFAIDTWGGDEHGGYYDSSVFNELQNYHNPLYGDFSKLIKSQFDDAVHFFSDRSIDLLHIDGYHTYEAVKHDFQTWLPKLSERSVVLFHDTIERENNFGAWRFWEEVSRDYPHFEFIHGHGLGVLGVGSNLPLSVKAFFEQDETATIKIRNFFFLLGNRLSLLREKQTVEIKINFLTNEISQHLNSLNAFQSEKSELEAQLTEKEQVVQALTAQLHEITISKAWRLAMLFRRIRVLLAPPGSWREKMGHYLFSLGKQKMIVSKKEYNGENKDNIFKNNNINSQTSKVSIIVPVYNAFDYTKMCIESVYKFTNDINFELIVVDNGSSDFTKKWGRTASSTYAGLQYIRLGKNLGFAPAVNIGIKEAKGEIIVILNNDTLVSPNWLNNLISGLRENTSIGIISPITNYVGEGQQIDPDAKTLPADLELISEFARNISDRKEIIFEPNRLVFFCVAIRRELFDLIGPLDENYLQANFEDDDFCLRARMIGYNLGIAKNAFVYHKGSVSFNLNKINHTELMELNRTRFYSKTGRIASSKPLMSALKKFTHDDDSISVIVRTKDRPNLLRKALSSLANQTYNNFEVILVNDGGLDVAEIVHQYNEYFNIKYLYHKKTKGRTAAINTGLNNSDGKWIAYLDDDDILYPWHLESIIQAKNMDGNIHKVYYSDYNRALFENSKSITPVQILGVPSWKFDLNQLLVDNFIPIHTYIHSRDCLDSTGLWDETIDRLEDYEFLLRLATAFSQFRHVDKITAEYRIYKDLDNSITGDGRRKYLSALRAIYDKYPVKDERINEFRKNNIARLENQVAEIERIYQLHSVSEARYHAIKTVFGF